MRVALYARVSSEVQEARGTIGSQIEALETRAKEEGHEVVKTYRDEGYSGARLDRPGLDALRDGAVEGAFEAVLVLCPDRLARHFAWQMVILDELRLHGVEVRFLDTPAFDNDPQARLMTQIQGVVAEYERAKITERHRRGKLYRSRLGEILSWKAPYGYRRIPRGPEGPAHLVVFEPEAEVVRRIFTEAGSEGSTLRRIVKGLYEERIVSPGGRPCWSVGTLRNVLRNEAYVGHTFYNRTEQVPAPPGSRRATRQRPRSREEWIRIPVPSIVTADAFAAANAVSRENQRFSRRRATPGAWLLRGLVVCGACDVRTNCQGKKDRDRTWFRYYRCCHADPLRAGGKACREKHIRAEALDSLVLEKVREVLLRPSMLLSAEAAVTERKAAPDEAILTAWCAKLERKLRTSEGERRRLLDIFQTGLLDLAELTRRVADIDSRREQTLGELASLSEQRKALAEKGHLSRRIADFAGRVLAALDGLEFDQKQRLLRLVIEEVRVKGTRVEIHFRIPLDEPPGPDDTPPAPESPPRKRVSIIESLRSVGTDERAVRAVRSGARARSGLTGRRGTGDGRELGRCAAVLRVVVRAGAAARAVAERIGVGKRVPSRIDDGILLR